MVFGPKDLFTLYFAKAFSEKGFDMGYTEEKGISPDLLTVSRESLPNGNGLFTVCFQGKPAHVEVPHAQEHGPLLNICRAVVAKYFELVKADTPA